MREFIKNAINRRSLGDRQFDHRYPRLIITSGGLYTITPSTRSLINDYVSDVAGYGGWPPRARRTRVFACCIGARFATAIPTGAGPGDQYEAKAAARSPGTRSATPRRRIDRSTGCLSADLIDNARAGSLARSVHISTAGVYLHGGPINRQRRRRRRHFDGVEELNRSVVEGQMCTLPGGSIKSALQSVSLHVCNNMRMLTYMF